ncbi:hypothetical protein AWC13_10815 [Mycobacterium kubicae]|nr:hypothetical protein AWC13_10815 [Mycobacterium kubicae]
MRGGLRYGVGSSAPTAASVVVRVGDDGVGEVVGPHADTSQVVATISTASTRVRGKAALTD